MNERQKEQAIETVDSMKEIIRSIFLVDSILETYGNIDPNDLLEGWSWNEADADKYAIAYDAICKLQDAINLAHHVIGCGPGAIGALTFGFEKIKTLIDPSKERIETLKQMKNLRDMSDPNYR